MFDWHTDVNRKWGRTAAGVRHLNELTIARLVKWLLDSVSAERASEIIPQLENGRRSARSVAPAPDVLPEPPPDASGPYVADEVFPVSVQTRVERTLVRDRRDTVACVVEWADDDPVATVAIRVPATPPATLLQKLRRADRIIRDARCACSWCRRQAAVAWSTRPCR